MFNTIKNNIKSSINDNKLEINNHTENYWLGLFYFVGIIFATTGGFFLLSFFTGVDKTDRISITENNYQALHENQKYKDEHHQPESKDSSEAILGNVADTILSITGDDKTECSMPVFNNKKQYWTTNCDYHQRGELKHRQFKITLANRVY